MELIIISFLALVGYVCYIVKKLNIQKNPQNYTSVDVEIYVDDNSFEIELKPEEEKWNKVKSKNTCREIFPPVNEKYISRIP